MYLQKEVLSEPRGEILENKYFYAEATIPGDPELLADQISCVMRSHNSLGTSTRKAFMAPAAWEAGEDSVRFAIVGEAESGLEERWRIENNEDGWRPQTEQAVTTFGVSEFLEETFGTSFFVRPLHTGINHMDDAKLIDSMQSLYYDRRAHFARWCDYPSLDDLVSAGNQEDSLLGSQGDYAAKSSYFDVVLHTKRAAKKFGRGAYSAACRNLFENAGVLLVPRVVSQLDDGRWEIRAAGRCHETSLTRGGRKWLGKEVPATDAVADPISYYLDASVANLKTFKTTAEHYDDIVASQKVADEIGMLGIPEPEDFIVKDRTEVLADDKARADGRESTLLEPELTGEEELDALVGLEDAKRQIREFVAFAAAQKERGGEMPSLNLALRGNPGTGKTDVARIVGHMLYDAGVLPKRNVFVETGGADLNYSNVSKYIASARRGILFIDEAYALHNSDVLAALVKAMEDCRKNYERDGFVCIMAGYPDLMDMMISRNPGMRDRMACYIDFEDYTVSELAEIFDLFVEKKGYSLNKGARDFVGEQIELIDMFKDADFGNARLMRRIVERCVVRQSSMHGANSVIRKDVVEDVFKDEFAELVGKQSRAELKKAEERAKLKGTPLSGDQQLDRLIGLEVVKRQIREYLDFAAVQHERHVDLPQMHMLMRGNPGTGKTTLARIVGQMAFERGLLLRNDRFVEGDRETLVGSFVGHTAPKTKAAIRKARHGVLFIDEAYALNGKSEQDYGNEALAVLVKAMEDSRNDFKRNGFICIMAGYTDLMDEMVGLNPGLRDRFGLTLDFPDYTPEEMMQIFLLYLEEGGYEIAKNAQQALAERFSRMAAHKDDDFANARLVRKVFERCQIKQAKLHGTSPRIRRDVVESVFEDADMDALLHGKGFGFQVA